MAWVWEQMPQMRSSRYMFCTQLRLSTPFSMPRWT